MGTTERRPEVYGGPKRRVCGREFAAECFVDGTGVAVVGPEVDADAHDVIVGTEEAGGLCDGVVAECGRQSQMDTAHENCLVRAMGARQSVAEDSGKAELDTCSGVEGRRLPSGRCATKKYGVAASASPPSISFRELMLAARVERSEVVPGFVRRAADSDGRAHAVAREVAEADGGGATIGEGRNFRR